MEYVSPKSVAETLRLLNHWKSRARVIAGGTNLIPEIREKAVTADVLVDLSRLKNLPYIKEEKRRIRIGGLTTISKLASSKVIQNHAPILSEAARDLGNPLVRNRATIGRAKISPLSTPLWITQMIPKSRCALLK